jgi:hypothetical protein
MEIVSYMLEGALTHKDSLGTGSVIQPGDVQRMTAGTGVRHSEFNHSQSELVHLLQIWILPEKSGLQPSYEQKTFTDEAKRGKLCLIGSRDGRDGSVTIHQDVDLYAALLDDGEEIEQRLGNGRKGWVQIARGSVRVNDTLLHAGDGVAIAEQTALTLRGSENAEVLLFDMG